MIQRIQSIWLLLAAAAALATLKFSFYSGVKDNNVFAELNGTAHFLLLILTVAVSLAALVSIFLFKNRKLQMQLCFLGLLLQIAVVFFYINQTQKFVQGTFALSAAFTFLIPVFFLLALLAIRKDEKLIKSMNRLR